MKVLLCSCSLLPSSQLKHHSADLDPSNHQTHLRAVCPYLGLALHHLELAEQDYYDDDDESEDRPSLEVTFKDLKEGIKSLKARERLQSRRLGINLSLAHWNSSVTSRWKETESESAKD